MNDNFNLKLNYAKLKKVGLETLPERPEIKLSV